MIRGKDTRMYGVAMIFERVPAIRSEKGTMVVEMEGTEKRAATGHGLPPYTVRAPNRAELLALVEMDSREAAKMAAAPAPAVTEMEGAMTAQ